MDYSALESSSTPFKPIYAILDSIYQYQHEVELPARCDEFFTEFSRLKNEEMQAYLVRHRTMMTKMNEVKVQLPNLLAGWHLMTRAGVPKGTHVQIKALCQGELEYEKVQKALMKMFGGDHKPNTKDLRTSGKEETFYEEEWEVYDDEEAYEMTVPTRLKKMKNGQKSWMKPMINAMRPTSATWRAGEECENWHCQEDSIPWWPSRRTTMEEEEAHGKAEVPGRTPFLLSRPTLEAWKSSVISPQVVCK